MGKVLDAANKLIDDAKDAWVDHSITVAELKGLYATGLTILDGLRDEPDAEADVTTALSRFYDTFLEPIDIPYLPAIGERWVDRSVKEASRAFIVELFRQAKA